MTQIAAIVIAGGNRTALIDEQILPSLVGFDDVLVVGKHHDGEGYKYLHVPDLTKTTNDALVKRDVGTLATTADLLVYLSDDHNVMGPFAQELRALNDEGLRAWDVLVPSRWTEHPEQGLIRIPNGETEWYCGGHGGVFRRAVIQRFPWTAQPHHRNWDLHISHAHVRAGVTYLPYARLQIQDLEPQASPWR